MEKGFIQVYTGNGKGKTSAAIGIAVKAAGANMKTLILQFMKDGFAYSELNSLSKLSEWITIERYGNDDHVLERREPTTTEQANALLGISRIEDAYNDPGFDILILDEICVAVHFGLLDQSRVTNILKRKPPHLEIILTGRYCPQDWIEMADLVTECREVKHYFSTGVLSRPGIDC